MKRRQPGFTLTELVMIIVIIGILAAFALPRFTDRTFAERGFRDGAKSVLQHARHLAVATRRYTCVSVTPGTGSSAMLSVSMDARVPETISAGISCTTAVQPLPAQKSSCSAGTLCAPSGVVLDGGSTGSFIFDPAGRSVTSGKVAAGNGTVLIANQPAITVYGETGFIQ